MEPLRLSALAVSIVVGSLAPAPLASAQTACGFTVTSNAPSLVPWSGGTYTITVTASDPSCAWGVNSTVNWLIAGGGGTGNGSFGVTVLPSDPTYPFVRTATVVLTGETTSLPILFTQSPVSSGPCMVGASPSVVVAPPEGLTVRIRVDTEPLLAPCPWGATSTAPWLLVGSPNLAGGFFDLTVAPTDSAGKRTGSVHLMTTGNSVSDVSITQLGIRTHPARFAEIAGPPGPDAFVYDPATGNWDVYSAPVDPSTDGAWQDSAYGRDSGGLPSGADVYLADFNGDGQQDVFAYDPTTGLWTKAVNRGATTPECPPAEACSQQRFDRYSGLWAPGWSITVLDLNGDGRSDLFLYNRTTGQWFSALTVNDGREDFGYVGGFWAPGWSVYRANFNGDGRDDLFLYNANPAPDLNSGRWFRVLGRGTGDFDYEEGNIRWASGWTVVPGDFNGDGLTELFLYGAWGTGLWFRVDFPGGPVATYPQSGVWAAGWRVSSGDFNADGRDDLFLYNSGPGANAGLWFHVLSNPDGTFTYRPWDVRWAGGWAVSIVDVDDDGADDVVLNAPTSGMSAQVLTKDGGVAYVYGNNWVPGTMLIAPYRRW